MGLGWKVAVVVLVLFALAACASGEPEGPATRSASEAPGRSTTTTSPGRPSLDRVGIEPGALAVEGDQRMVAVAADAAGTVAVAVGTDQGGPALWRAVEADVWTRVPNPEEIPSTARLAHVAASATGRFMVVGAVDGMAAAWTSTDGSVWSRADVDAGPPIAFVADTAVGPVAFSSGPEATAWKSWDGQVWLRSRQPVPARGPPRTAEVVGLADTDAGVVAVVERSEGGPQLWSSPDGLSWADVPATGEELLGTAGDLSVGAALTRGRSEVEIAGSVGGGHGVDAAVWRSEGGRTWEAVPPDQNVFGGDGDQVITAMEVGPDGRSVAVGTDTAEGQTDADVAVWVASDEGVWARADAAAPGIPGHQEVGDVAVIDGAVVAVGFERIDGQDDAAVWQVGSVPVEMPPPVEGPVPTWERVDAEALGAPGEQRLSAVTASVDGYVAVGATRRPLGDPGVEGPSSEIGPVPVGDSDGAVWISADGREWEQVGTDVLGGEGDQELDAVAQGPDGLVAVGRDGDEAAVWRSADGRRWLRVPDVDGVFGGVGRQEMRGVVAMGPRFIAVGTDSGAGDGDGAVWASDDGRAWRRVAAGPFGGPGAQVMSGVALGPDQVVVVGADGDEAAAWTSVDLVGWSSQSLGPGRASAVDGLDGSVVAVGSAPGADGELDAVAWRLVGTIWERIEGGALGRPANQELTGVALGETAVGVGVTDAGGGDDAASWASADAVTWNATPHDENVLGGDSGQRMTDVVTVEGTSVAVGWSGSTPEARDAVVWIADQVGVSGPEGRL